MSELADAHIALMARIRANLVTTVERIWNALPGHDRSDIAIWLRLLLPVLLAHQRQASLGTQAYIARLTQQAPLGLDPDPIIAAIRGGVPPSEVYHRPFVTLWTDLKEGKGFPDANRAALDRATSTAQTDTQLAMTHTLRAAGEASDLIVGFQRVPDATACDFCRICAGQRYTKRDLMPLHNRCGCGVDIITTENRHLFAKGNPKNDLHITEGDLTVAIREHGELGPVLTNTADHFTPDTALTAPATP